MSGLARLGAVVGVGALGLWLIPAVVRRLRDGPRLEVGSHDAIEVDVPLEACSAWLRDATNLPLYEEKVERVEVATAADGSTLYTCWGSYFGFPWWGTFSMRHTPDGGFHSEMVAGPHRGRASGGFRLRRHDAGTRITHYEHYGISVWVPMAAAMAPWVRRWLDRTLHVEMETIRRALSARGLPPAPLAADDSQKGQ